MANDNKLLNPLFGLGIAGNSAGHLQQTGEIKGLCTNDDAAKPQALFPFFVVNAKEDNLSCMPYSTNQLRLPKEPDALVQMEAELALKLAVVYGAEGDIKQLTAISMTVVNDATYRNAKVCKLAEKKNWGLATKGIAEHEIVIDKFKDGGELDHFRLCGFHQSNGQWQLCGQDTGITEYTYFYQELLQWILKQIHQQQDKGVLHNIQNLLSQANYPEQILISIGATRYSDYGEKHHLSFGDQLVVALYDSRSYHFQELFSLLKQTGSLQLYEKNKIIFLQQQVV